MSLARLGSHRLLGLIAAILTVAALRASYPVTMPLAVSILLIAAIWPVKQWFDRMAPRLAYLGTGVVLLLILVLFFGSLYFSATQVVQAFGDNWGQLEKVYRSLNHYLEGWGINGIGIDDRSRLIGVGQDILTNASTILIYLGFIALMVMLGLGEATRLASMLSRLVPTGSRDIANGIGKISEKMRQYIAVTFLTSLLTGIATTLWAFAIGLELPFVWGLLNFLLNFVPMVGNVVGIVPPTLFAFLQYGDWTHPLLSLMGFGLIQITISNVVYPMLQARSLSLSPMAVVVSLAFWSWVWGLAGAFVAIPLTVSVAIVCRQFAETRWVAALLVFKEVDADG